MDNVNPLLTDKYQLTMAYAYWKCNRHNNHAVFDLFFRKCPFGGEFAIFAGLSEVISFVHNYRFTTEDIEYLKEDMPDCDPAFFIWLAKLNCLDVKIRAIAEGSVVFPRVPLIRVEGPLAICQLLETTMLNLVNYGTLVATNAARFRIAAGEDKKLLEFGLRRAQGPDGGLTASRCSYIGGFDGTSNVLAGKKFGIPVSGTHAHAFVQSFTAEDYDRPIHIKGTCINDMMRECHIRICATLGLTSTNIGELAAFANYAAAFPDKFLALVDTYDTLESGVPNFLIIACVLRSLGYDPIGIRLDSGDLAYLSKEARAMFKKIDSEFENLVIAASNDINEGTLLSLKEQGHEIDMFGVGTHLVTCQAQPALGGVFKLVAINGKPRIKLSNDIIKITIPGCKAVYRLFDSNYIPIIDLITGEDEEPPEVGKRILCRDPFNPQKRAYFTPQHVMRLDEVVWDINKDVVMDSDPKTSTALASNKAREQLMSMREDHLRLLNPTPYKVSVSEIMFNIIQTLWSNEAPISEL